jgi:hypothetical protein
MQTHKIEPHKCPNCLSILTETYSNSGPLRAPEGGDITVCGWCGEPSIMKGIFHYRLTDVEFDKMLKDLPEIAIKALSNSGAIGI